MKNKTYTLAGLGAMAGFAMVGLAPDGAMLLGGFTLVLGAVGVLSLTADGPRVRRRLKRADGGRGRDGGRRRRGDAWQRAA